MKRVLVPTDFSTEASNAADFAIQYSKKADAELHFIHLMTIPIDWFNQGLVHEKMYPEITQKVNEAKANLTRLVETAKEAGVTAHQYIHYNESLEGILSYIPDNHIDLVIMGSKGASGFKELLIGSYTEKLIRHAPCPVLVVKEAVDLNTIKTILLPTDMSSEQAPAVHMAKEWATFCKATLHLVKLNTHYRWDESDTFANEIESFASQYQIEDFKARTFDADYIEDGIIECAEDIDCDLIIMGTHKRTGIAHIVAGSITEAVSNHARRLILTLAV